MKMVGDNASYMGRLADSSVNVTEGLDSFDGER